MNERTDGDFMTQGYPIRNNGLQKKIKAGETIIQVLLFLAGFVSIFTTIGIVFVLGKDAWLFFRHPEVSLLDLLI